MGMHLAEATVVDPRTASAAELQMKVNICSRPRTLAATAVILSLAVCIARLPANDPKKSAQPVIFALKQYRLRFGSYPANLNELVELRFLRNSEHAFRYLVHSGLT